MPLIISNASPLIALSLIDRLYILKELWSEITIPNAVYKEVVLEGEGKPGAQSVVRACNEWIITKEVKNYQEVQVLRAILDEGEAEVIALGQEMNADLLLLDNREPRLFAASANLKLIGTLGIIKLAWLKGIIKNLLDDIRNLRNKSFYISDNLFKRIQQEIEEITGK